MDESFSIFSAREKYEEDRGNRAEKGAQQEIRERRAMSERKRANERKSARIRCVAKYEMMNTSLTFTYSPKCLSFPGGDRRASEFSNKIACHKPSVALHASALPHQRGAQASTHADM